MSTNDGRTPSMSSTTEEVMNLITDIEEVVNVEEWDSSAEADEHVQTLLEQALVHLRGLLPEEGPTERTHLVDMYGDPMPTDFMSEPCDNDGEGGTCSVCGSQPTKEGDDG